MATPILIGKKPNDTLSTYSGRAYVKETINTAGKYYNLGFVSQTIYVENRGSDTLYLSFKSDSEIDQPIDVEPSTIHAEIAPSTSRIFNNRHEKYIKVFAASSSSSMILEAW